MRLLLWLAGGLLVMAGTAYAEPYYPFNAADFVVPVDELDAATVGEAAVHAGFRPLPDHLVKHLAVADVAQTYGAWELPSHRFATITLVKMKDNTFSVMFISKEPARHGNSLTGDACRKWLSFSGAMRSEFGRGQSKFRFRNPQCDP